MRTRRLVMILAVVGMVMGVMAPAAVGAPAIRDTVNAPFAEVFGDGGSASIVRTDSGISVRVHAEGLRPGNAYTAWFAVFDGATDACNLDMGFPGGILTNMAGHVVTGGGTATFSGQLSAGPIGEPNGMDILLNDDGSFDNPLGACVDIHIVNHGPAGDFLPGELNDAINTIFGAMPPADQVYRFVGEF